MTPPPKDFTLLDGAMGTALRERGVEVPDYKSSIWSALALIEAPEAVQQLHLDYINAGADVVIANNYAVVPKLLAREGMERRAEELTLIAARLANAAREASGKNIKVAGSLPPLDTSYCYELVGPYEENLAVYRTLAQTLEPHVDILLCETMTTAEEARAAATAATETGKEVWVSWTIDPTGQTLRGGDSISEALAAIKDLPVSAVFLNCSAAEPITKALPKLLAEAVLPVGAYCNPVRQEWWTDDGDQRTREPIGPRAYAELAQGWLDMGVQIVGGCCGTNPDYIAEISALKNN